MNTNNCSDVAIHHYNVWNMEGFGVKRQPMAMYCCCNQCEWQVESGKCNNLFATASSDTNLFLNVAKFVQKKLNRQRLNPQPLLLTCSEAVVHPCSGSCSIIWVY